MAIYVVLTGEELAHIAHTFRLGKVTRAEGVPQGSINTNYRLDTERGRFFLRHTGVRSEADLRFEAALLDHLKESGFPAPHLHRTLENQPLFFMRDGWVSVFGYLSGEELSRPQLTVEVCENLGAELGKMHRITQSFQGDRENPYRQAVVRGWLEGLMARPEADLQEISRELLGYLDAALRQSTPLIPRGVIHADLFMDNVKWVGERVSAFFDFEMACREPYTLDLAITLNAWCFDGSYQPEFCAAMMRGYLRQRPLSTIEREDLFARALFGAVRYTASRIRDFHLSPLPPDKLSRKDFRTYLARCRALVAMGPAGFQKLLGL